METGRPSTVLERPVDPCAAVALLVADQTVADFTEGSVQVGVDLTEDGDDADAEDRSNEAVFDGRGARLILQEARENVRHDFETPNVDFKFLVVLCVAPAIRSELKSLYA